MFSAQNRLLKYGLLLSFALLPLCEHWKYCLRSKCINSEDPCTKVQRHSKPRITFGLRRSFKDLEQERARTFVFESTCENPARPVSRPPNKTLQVLRQRTWVEVISNHNPERQFVQTDVHLALDVFLGGS